MNGMKRTNYCGELRKEDVGKTVVVCGWVARQRDLGGLIFIDLRDRTGIVQLAFDENTEKSVFEKAGDIRSEYVLMAKGEVIERESKNDKLKTGHIEIFVNDLRILSKAQKLS
jgi:aspartyl-tRNA synthetase